MFFQPVGDGLIAADILKTVFMLCLFALLGEIGSNNSPDSPGLVATQATFSGKDGFTPEEHIHPIHNPGLLWPCLTKYGQVAFSARGLDIGLFKKGI